MKRLASVERHLDGGHNERVGLVKDDREVVIIDAVRTPICRARKGGLKDALAEDLLSAALAGLLKKTGIDPSVVQDIQVGNVLQPGAGATTSRMAMFHAGFPVSTPLGAVNRQCSSGLQAVVTIATEIKAGYIDVGIGAGVESMTHNYGPQAMPANLSESVMNNSQASDCLLPMGETSERVASRFGVGREEQDQFAAWSHLKAAKAKKHGWFKDEIVPVMSKGQLIIEDDGIRAGTTPEQLAKLKPSFRMDGSTTPGNASQVSDGAAAVLLMSRAKAYELGLPIRARFIGFAVAGCDPEVMGIGPVLAVPKVLAQVGLSLNDISIFELNEAFASQAVYCMKTLKIPKEKINPVGGAIALGHPLGATGARQIATLLSQFNRMRQDGKKEGPLYGIVTMCIGTGMGAAAILAHEG